MRLHRWTRILGVLLGMALLWAVAGSLRSGLAPWNLFSGTSRAAPPKDGNPCNPNAKKAGNPCNPNAGAAAKSGNPCNPCNPNGGAAAKAGNPCNPNGGAAAKSSNPCNPNGGTATKADNPCNPGAQTVGLRSNGSKIGWAREFKTWDATTGYVLSNSHGNRLVQTYIYPPEAVRVYKHNAELARLRKAEGYLPYPDGTEIAQESWLRNELGGPGQAGPVFFMRKEPGDHWHFGFTRDDLSLIGEGTGGKMQFCQECHSRATRRDSVYATER